MPFKFGKKIFFPKHIASPPDKGDLGGFFHWKSSSNNALKLFMRRAVVFSIHLGL